MPTSAVHLLLMKPRGRIWQPPSSPPAPTTELLDPWQGTELGCSLGLIPPDAGALVFLLVLHAGTREGWALLCGAMGFEKEVGE